MTADELLNLLSPENRSLLSNSFLKAGINTSNTLVVGLPLLGSYTDPGTGITINDWNFLVGMPFIIVKAKDYKKGLLTFIEDIFSLQFNMFEDADSSVVNSLVIFPKAQSSKFSLDASNNLDQSLFQELLNLSSQLNSLGQASGIFHDIQTILQKVAGFASNISTDASALIYSLAGMKFELPKIWENGVADVKLEVSFDYKISQDGNDPDKIKQVLNTIKSYAVPRDVNHTDQKVSSGKQKPNTNASSKTKPDSSSNTTSVNLTDFEYKYPYYCSVYFGPTGSVIHELAMVTGCSIDYNIFDVNTLTLEGIPQVISCSLTFESIFPYRASSGSSGAISDDMSSSASFEKVIDSLLTNTTSRRSHFANTWDYYKNRPKLR